MVRRHLCDAEIDVFTIELALSILH
jgi:hypothetical protein